MIRAFRRYRPRILTVVLLFVVAAVIAMANFTSDVERIPGRGGLTWLPARLTWALPMPRVGAKASGPEGESPQEGPETGGEE